MTTPMEASVPQDGMGPSNDLQWVRLTAYNCIRDIISSKFDAAAALLAF